MPNVLLEAQYLKKPIISSDCPTGPKEILLGGKAGFLFNVGNIKQLEKQIMFVSKKKNSDLLKSKSRKGLKHMNRFDYDLNMNKYLKLINNNL